MSINQVHDTPRGEVTSKPMGASLYQKPLLYFKRFPNMSLSHLSPKFCPYLLNHKRMIKIYNEQSNFPSQSGVSHFPHSILPQYSIGSSSTEVYNISLLKLSRI